MKKLIYILVTIVTLAFTSCSQQQEQARKPISHTSGTFIKESIERNKILVASEEKTIDSLIKNDTL